MAGIVTTSSNTGSVRTYKAVFSSTSTSLAINWISGTTSGSAVPHSPLDKGVEVTFQNVSTGTTNVWIGGADVAPNFGILVVQNAAYTIGKRHAPSAIQLDEWYVCSTSSVAVAIAQLIKAV